MGNKILELFKVSVYNICQKEGSEPVANNGGKTRGNWQQTSILNITDATQKSSKIEIQMWSRKS